MSSSNKILKVKNNYRTKIIKDKTELLRYYQLADLVIASGGTMMFEAMSLGKLVMAYKNYQHQIKIINYFKKKKCLIEFPYKKSVKEIYNFLKEILFNLKKDSKYYDTLKNNSKRFVNLHGLDNTIKLIESKIIKKSKN